MSIYHLPIRTKGFNQMALIIASALKEAGFKALANKLILDAGSSSNYRVVWSFCQSTLEFIRDNPESLHFPKQLDDMASAMWAVMEVINSPGVTRRKIDEAFKVQGYGPEDRGAT